MNLHRKKYSLSHLVKDFSVTFKIVLPDLYSRGNIKIFYIKISDEQYAKLNFLELLLIIVNSLN